MRPLTDREKRTIRIAAAAIVIYLGLFYGVRGWKSLESARLEYRELVTEARNVNQDLRDHENRILLLEKLKGTLRIDPSAYSRNTVVAETSAAIQKAAQAGNIALGPIREGPGNPASGERATMQLEATGPVDPVLTLIHQIEALGFPLIIDSVRITPEANQPGSVKVNLQIVILDFDRWISLEEERNASTL